MGNECNDGLYNVHARYKRIEDIRSISCFPSVKAKLGIIKQLISKISKISKIRACLHGGGGPQVGEVTRLAVVEKWPAFTCKLTTPGPRGDFT